MQAHVAGHKAPGLKYFILQLEQKALIHPEGKILDVKSLQQTFQQPQILTLIKI